MTLQKKETWTIWTEQKHARGRDLCNKRTSNNKQQVLPFHFYSYLRPHIKNLPNLLRRTSPTRHGTLSLLLDGFEHTREAKSVSAG